MVEVLKYSAFLKNIFPEIKAYFPLTNICRHGVPVKIKLRRGRIFFVYFLKMTSICNKKIRKLDFLKNQFRQALEEKFILFFSLRL